MALPVIKVNVKWQKTKFSDVELDLKMPPEIFKAALYSLSGVPPARQKVMVKGAVVGDESWNGLELKPGATLMLMGSAEALPEAPKEQVKFVEDMDDKELAKVLNMPSGLNNLGNTCYMNATLQCLRAVPELKACLKKNRLPGFLQSAEAAGPDVVVSAMSALFATLETAAAPVSPHVFLTIMHSTFPHFATRGERGAFQQQDANECFVELVRCLQQKLPAGLPDETAPPTFTDRYLTGTMECVLTCDEETAEPKTTENFTETFSQLSCFINKDVKYLHTGLLNALKTSLTKYSNSLSRDASFTKTCKISRLPAYLSIQFVRFFYKEKEQINAKVLKDVKFTLAMDMFTMCTPALQQKLLPLREQFQKQDDYLSLRKTASKSKAEDVKLPDLGDAPPPSYWLSDDVGSNGSGHYVLQAVLTHQGRSSNEGHYVGWVRKSEQDPLTALNPEEEVWFKFDDDDVTPVTGADVLRLSGGGDWHCAYVLLYGPRVLDKDYSAMPAPETAPMDTTP